MVGEACLSSNAYYPRTPDYTLYSGAHVCWFEHSDSSFVYGFMSLDYGLGTMTTTTCLCDIVAARTKAFSSLMSRLMTKETKRHVRPAKTQINLGFRPVWSVFDLQTMGSKGPKLSACVQRRLWSVRMDAQADLSFRWAHMTVFCFCHSRRLIVFMFHYVFFLLVCCLIVWCSGLALWCEHLVHIAFRWFVNCMQYVVLVLPLGVIDSHGRLCCLVWLFLDTVDSAFLFC